MNTNHRKRSASSGPSEPSPPPSPPPAGTTGSRCEASPSCLGRTADGRACTARPQAGSRYCFFHDPEAAEARLEARRAGGRERSRRLVTLPETESDLRLDTVADVTRLLGDTINRVRKGTLDVRVANTVGYLAGVLLRSLEVGDLEDRLARLEAVSDRTPARPAGAFATSLMDITDDRPTAAEDPAQ